MDISPSQKNRSEKKDLQESSEISSSSKGTVDNRDDGTGNQEVESIFHEYPPSTLHDMPTDLFETKKKVTDLWRRFTRLITWRFQNQAKLYDRELADCYQNKVFELEKMKLLGFDPNSLFVSCPYRGSKIIKRRRQTRVEENADVKSYISRHNILSYYESWKPVVLDAWAYEFSDDRSKNTENVTNSESIDDLKLTPRDVCLENLFRKIEETQNRSRKLKNRVMNLVNEHPVKDSTNHNNDKPIPPTAAAAANVQRFTLAIGEELSWVDPTFVEDQSEIDFPEEGFNLFEKALNDVTRIPQVSPENPQVSAENPSG